LLSYAFGSFQFNQPLDTGAMQTIGSITLTNAGTYLMFGQVVATDTSSSPVMINCVLQDNSAAWESFTATMALFGAGGGFPGGSGTIPIQSQLVTTSAGDTVYLNCQAAQILTGVSVSTGVITAIQVK
jgi:hypothetical protein